MKWKDVFTKEFFVQLVFQIVLTSGIIFIWQKSYESSLAEQRTKRETFMAEKREAYYKAIEVAFRYMATLDYKEYGTGKPTNPNTRNKGASLPSEIDLNMAAGKLFLYSKDSSVLSSYYALIAKHDSSFIPMDYMRNFLMVISKDLGNSLEGKDSFPLMYLLSDTSNKRKN